MTVISSIWLLVEWDHFTMEGREYLVRKKRLEQG